MAKLVREGDELVLHLMESEKLEGLHGDLHIPVGHVASVEAIDHPIGAVGGMKVMGARLPGLFAMGTYETTGGPIFAMVHRGAARGIRIHIQGGGYTAVIISAEDPEGTIASLGL